MKKTIHKLSHILSGCLLAALCFATSLAGIFTGAGTKARETVTASAAFGVADTRKELADNNFEFAAGAALAPKDVTDEAGNKRVSMNRMSFTLLVPNEAAIKSNHEKDKGSYTFTLHRMHGEKSYTPVARFYITWSGSVVIGYKKELATTKDTFEFTPDQLQGSDWSRVNSIGYAAQKALYETQGYELMFINQNVTENVLETWTAEESYNGRWDHRFLRFVINTNSVTTDYFVRFEYKVERYYKETGKLPFIGDVTIAEGYKTEAQGVIDSDVRSARQILVNMDAAGKLEYEMERLASDEEISDAALAVETAQEIIANEKKEVTVSYLRQIGKTPFAEKVTETVEVPFENGGLTVDAVAAALDVKSFEALDSECYGFVYNATSDTYNARYLKNIYLTIRTVDGNTPDAADDGSQKYYLDINQSFADYYGALKDRGHISESQYEWLFSKILSTYPALSGKKMGEVYGYFGYAVIPELKYSINGFFDEIFAMERSYKGAVYSQTWDENLSASEYDDLLDHFQYGWLERAWHGFLNNTAGGGNNPATHIAFYCDEFAPDAVISDNGTADVEDNDGLIENTVQKVVVEIKDTISGDNEEGRGLKVILGVAIGGLAVFGIAYGVIKLKNLSESKK